MLWGFSATGPAAEVAKRLTEEAEWMRNICSEPEETIKNAVLGALLLAVEGEPRETVIKVMVSRCHSAGADTLSVTMEPR